MGQPLIGRPLYAPRKEEASFADGRLNALALCLLESLGVRHEVVSAFAKRKWLNGFNLWLLWGISSVEVRKVDQLLDTYG